MAERPEFVDEMESADPVEVQSPEPAAPPDLPVEEPAASAQVADDADMFPRDYVENLRRENAKYRTRAQQYEQAFEGYDDDARAALLQYVSLSQRAQAGDQQAQAELDAWLADDDDDTAAQQDYSNITAEQYMEMVREAAREEAQRIVAEREAYQSQQAAVDGVRQTAEQMGYQFGSPDYMLLLKFANELDPEEHPDLLAAANDQVKAYHRSIIEAQQEAYLAEKEQQALSSPRVAGAGTSPDLTAGPPKTFAEARARMDERLANT